MEMIVQVTMSATVGAIGAALAKAQLVMKPAAKDGFNPHFKNRYATLASCIEALRPFHENGIAVIQPPAIQGAEGVAVSTLLIHSSGEWIRGDIYMPASKRDAQGFGSALSYARRYCLTATTNLATDDDDGEEAVNARPVPAPTLEDQLQASVEVSDPEAEHAKALRAAKNLGQLNEAWAAISADKRLDQLARRRLAVVKDRRKAELTPNGAEAR